jgi:hypothetical protein
MTVAPHRDIWPQGSTYPKNAVAISNKSIVVPLHQTPLIRNLLILNPRTVWRYKNNEKRVAPIR